MARKPLAPALKHGPEFVGATPPAMAVIEVAMHQADTATALAISQHDAGVRAVAQQLGYQLPADCTDPDLIQRDIAANMRRSVEACLEVGRGLAVLKQACQHGQFMARLEVLGIDDGVARKFIRAATKFSNRSSTTVLKAAGSQTKLFELLILDDDQIEDLELTGQTGELSLDDIASMSVSELRTALREERAQHAATDKLLAATRDELDNAKRAKAKLELRTASWDERVDAFKGEIGERQKLLDKLVGAHLEAVTALDVWYTQEVCAAPDYDPESDATMPPAVQTVLLTLSDAVERTARLVGALQNELETRFGADIDDARRHLLREPGDQGAA
ncbi:hypothetical protein ACNQFN_11395 [Thauera butanivorans]|uniref:hypothetical protein n=1 Tax=Thauera butanivorans TaxID=86174 RepID=UPI003AB16373